MKVILFIPYPENLSSNLGRNDVLLQFMIKFNFKFIYFKFYIVTELRNQVGLIFIRVGMDWIWFVSSIPFKIVS